MIPRHTIRTLLVILCCSFGFSLPVTGQNESRPAEAQVPPPAQTDAGPQRSEQKPQKGLDELKKDLAELEAAKGKDHPDLVPVLLDIARAYAGQEGYVPALEAMRRALEITGKVPGKDDLEIASIAINVATMEHAAGDNASALQHFESVRATVEKKFGAGHIGIIRVQALMGGAYLELGKLNEAETILEKVLQRLAQDYGVASEEVSPVQELLGEVYLREGNLSGAEQQLRFALVVRSEAGDIPVAAGQLTAADAQAIMAPIRNLLGALYTVAGLYDQAEPFLNDALKAYEVKMGAQSVTLESVLVNLATLAEAKGDAAAAAAYQKRAEQIHKAATGFSHLPNVPLPRSFKALVPGEKAALATARVGDWVSYADGEGAPSSRQEVLRKTATALVVVNFEWDAKNKVWARRGYEEALIGLAEGIKSIYGVPEAELIPEKADINGKPVQAVCQTMTGGPGATQCKLCFAPEVVPLGGLVKVECGGKTQQRVLDFGRGK